MGCAAQSQRCWRGTHGSGDCRGGGLSLPSPPGSPGPAGGARAPAQWSLKPGMGKARAKVSTRWRSSAKRRCVSASCSKKVLKSWSFPGGGGGAGEKRGGLYNSPGPWGKAGINVGDSPYTPNGEVPTGTREGETGAPPLTHWFCS